MDRLRRECPNATLVTYGPDVGLPRGQMGNSEVGHTNIGAGRVVGSAKMGPNRPARGAHIATASFMVDAEAGTRGVGRALGEHVVAWAREGGYAGIQFNAVVETNERAVRLWRSLGFEVIGTVPGAFDHPEHGPVGLHVMFLDLGRTAR